LKVLSNKKLIRPLWIARASPPIFRNQNRINTQPLISVQRCIPLVMPLECIPAAR
jgi:hypothetical protein